MSETKRLIIMGFGLRGQIYAAFAERHPEQFEVAAVVDTDPEKRELAAKRYRCPVYADCAAYFAAPVEADAAAVAVRDGDHPAVARSCMRAGYDVLLEKPIACTLADCVALEREARQYRRRVIVCHVLRYTPFYSRVKRAVDEGALGEIVTIHASENVGYWHQAHSFVRGPWRNAAESTPMIVAKCCHDMDLLRWLTGKRPLKVGSFGCLTHFSGENAPEGAAAYCSECPVADCLYNAQRFYTGTTWCAGYFMSGERTEQAILSALEKTQYDRCVYRSDNDAVDHQVTIVSFENGVTATHTMTAFSKECYRDIKIYGTKAELVGVFERNRFEVRPFGGSPYVVEIPENETGGNHGGGDEGLMRRFHRVLTGEKETEASSLSASLDSHKMAFAAEQSRLTGKIVDL